MSAKNEVFDPAELGGSIKRNIVNPMLVAERQKCNFDKTEAFNTLFNEDQQFEFKYFERIRELHPETNTKIEYFEMSRMEKITEWWDRLKVIMHDPELSKH